MISKVLYKTGPGFFLPWRPAASTVPVLTQLQRKLCRIIVCIRGHCGALWPILCNFRTGLNLKGAMGVKYTSPPPIFQNFTAYELPSATVDKIGPYLIYADTIKRQKQPF
jgi:hypothetical protein